MDSIQTKHSAYYRFLDKTSYGMAILGGLLLCFMALLTVASVIGRNVFLTPIPGDFDIVGMGTAIAAFLCLPYCQWRRGNITVDFFLANAPRKVTAVADAFAALVFAALAAVLTWRTWLGMVGFYRYQDITQIAAIPLWWAFPFGVLAFLMLTLNCLYMAANEFKRPATGAQNNNKQESAA